MTTPHSDLPAFSGDDPTCAKCGHVGAYTTYRKKGEPGKDFSLPSGLPERLERECGRCDFTWDEAVATGEEQA